MARRRYRITLEDESTLQKRAELRVAPWQALLGCLLLFLVLMLLAGTLILSSPMRRLLPGFLEASQRDTSVENILRLDSLQERLNLNQAYLDNIATIFDTERAAKDERAQLSVPRTLNDTIAAPSERERRFVHKMEEQEKYNLSILAPLAAEGLLFSDIADQAVISSDSEQLPKARILTASGSPVYSLAEGRVVDCHSSPAEGGWVVVMLHPKGFVTRYSHLPKPIISLGEHLESGQPITSGMSSNPGRAPYFYIEMWRNGDELIPARFLEELAVVK